MSEPTEIERKFLIRNCPPLDGFVAEDVRQGYITRPEDSSEVRLRQKGTDYFITVKSGGTLSRTEHETPISAEQFEALWPTTKGRQVEKTRYTGTLPDGRTVELDVFGGTLSPLMLAEVEFPSPAEANNFVVPGWFGTDVTTEKGFKNKALAFHGIPYLRLG